ncbi:hypothetical protein BD410DRAFT_211448 [Rickenella mellea]|uniref:Uncharacterized protein n=1 Tax=Rickenella mellea TaxID=50990 RepID=A0A4Y7Q5G1_9AGAM|nr:hypothetical protein BD410DRAFT_211448 [Rickenella mellea]
MSSVDTTSSALSAPPAQVRRREHSCRHRTSARAPCLHLKIVTASISALPTPVACLALQVGCTWIVGGLLCTGGPISYNSRS